MAGLKRTQRRGAPMDAPATFRSGDDRTGVDHLRPTVRPRFGTGARPAARRKASDGLLHWRLLALGACALILGTGGVIAIRSMAPVTPPQVASGQPANPSLQGGPVLAAASATATPGALASGTARAASPAAPLPAGATAAQAAPQAAAGHAQMATQVASILGSGGPVAESAEHINVATIAPTAEDLARPAFLEPPDGDEDDLPEGAAEAAGDAAPLPLPRPADAIADAQADGARSARIRSAVTLRSGPRRSASAIGTLDEGTRVTLYSCKSWCEVSSGDKRGFVYKSAVAQ